MYEGCLYGQGEESVEEEDPTYARITSLLLYYKESLEVTECCHCTSSPIHLGLTFIVYFSFFIRIP